MSYSSSRFPLYWRLQVWFFFQLVYMEIHPIILDRRIKKGMEHFSQIATLAMKQHLRGISDVYFFFYLLINVFSRSRSIVPYTIRPVNYCQGIMIRSIKDCQKIPLRQWYMDQCDVIRCLWCFTNCQILTEVNQIQPWLKGVLKDRHH